MPPTPPRPPRFAGMALALACASGCGLLVDPALSVHVTLDPAVKATCVQLSVYSSSDVTSVAPAETARVARGPGKDEVSLGIYKGQLPGQVWVTARPMWGADCQDPLVPNGAAVVKSGSFPASGVTPVEMAIAAPTAAEDGDGDGFPSVPAGGWDCNDGSGAVNPGATEHCLEAADFNCDGKIGCADPTCPSTGCLASPSQLAFATPVRSLVAGTCSTSPVTVETRDGAGVALPVVVPTTVTFSSPDVKLDAFSDSACRNAATTATIPVGSARASVYVSGTVAGSATLGASAPGLGSITQTETILAAAPSQLVFLATTPPVPVNGCSPPLTVQVRDAFGNPAPALAARNLTLGSDGGASFKFYPDAACGQSAITQIQLPASQSTVTFYFKSTATAGGTVTVTVTDGSRTATQQQTLEVRNPTQLVFTGTPAPVPQNACSPAVTLQTQDVAGQPAPVTSSTSIGLSVAPTGAVTFYSNATCTTAATAATIGAGLSSTSFYFKGNQQGAATLTAAGGVLGSPAQIWTVGPPQATLLAFTTSAQTAVVAGTCSGAVNIDSQDAVGAVPVTANTAVSLSTSPTGQLSFYSDAACTAAITSATLGSGTSRVTLYFKGTVAGSTTVTASATGLTPASQVEGVVAAAAARVMVVGGDPQNNVTAGTCSAAVTIELQDAFGNPVSSSGKTTVNLTVNPLGAVTFFTASDCTGSTTTAQVSAGAQRGTFYFQGTVARPLTVTETPQSASLTGDDATATIQPGLAVALRYASAAQTVAAGACSADVTLTTYDAFSNVAPVSGGNAQVTLGATGITGMSFFSGSGCSPGNASTTVTISSGSSSATYSFSSNRSGNGNLTATTAGLGSPTQAVTVNPGPPTKLVFTQAAVTVAAGVCTGPATPLSIQAQDAFGNPAPVAADTDVALSGQNQATAYGITFYTNNCSGGGVPSVRITAGTTTAPGVSFKTSGAGTWTVTGQAPPLTDAVQNETVNPLAPSKLVYTTVVTPLGPSACSPRVGFQLQDSLGNPSPPASSVTVNLTPGGDPMYSRSNCSGTITGNQIVLSAGATDGSYYFDAPALTGNYTIGVNATGITSGSQTWNIQ